MAPRPLQEGKQIRAWHVMQKWQVRGRVDVTTNTSVQHIEIARACLAFETISNEFELCAQSYLRNRPNENARMLI